MLALDLYAERLKGDEPEPSDVVAWPLNQINELVARNDVTEGRAIAALYIAQQWLESPKQSMECDH